MEVYENTHCCVFCYRVFNQGENDISSLKKGDDDGEQRQKQFLLLLKRYLQKDSSESAKWINLFSDAMKSSESMRNVILPCTDCSGIIRSFCEYYEEIELLEMKLRWRIWTLANIVKSSRKIKFRKRLFQKTLGKYDTGGENNEDFMKHLKGFRAELVIKCTEKLHDCYPKVELRRYDITSKKRHHSNVDEDALLGPSMKVPRVDQSSSSSRETEKLKPINPGDIFDGEDDTFEEIQTFPVSESTSSLEMEKGKDNDCDSKERRIATMEVFHDENKDDCDCESAIPVPKKELQSQDNPEHGNKEIIKINIIRGEPIQQRTSLTDDTAFNESRRRQESINQTNKCMKYLRNLSSKEELEEHEENCLEDTPMSCDERGMESDGGELPYFIPECEGENENIESTGKTVDKICDEVKTLESKLADNNDHNEQNGTTKKKNITRLKIFVVNSKKTPMKLPSNNTSVSCRFCQAKFPTSNKLQLHMVSFHCRHFFPQQKSDSVSDLQLEKILAHHLFPDLMRNKTCCVFCKRNFTMRIGDMHRSISRFQLHIIQAHFQEIEGKLRKIQSDSLNLSKVLKKIEIKSDKAGGRMCECGVYLSDYVKRRTHDKLYCNLSQRIPRKKQENLIPRKSQIGFKNNLKAGIEQSLTESSEDGLSKSDNLTMEPSDKNGDIKIEVVEID